MTSRSVFTSLGAHNGRLIPYNKRCRLLDEVVKSLRKDDVADHFGDGFHDHLSVF